MCIFKAHRVIVFIQKLSLLLSGSGHFLRDLKYRLIKLNVDLQLL